MGLMRFCGLVCNLKPSAEVSPMGAPTNNKQVLRDYRLVLYQKHLGTVDLEFAEERNSSDETDRIDVLGFERDFTESCEPGSDLGYVL